MPGRALQVVVGFHAERIRLAVAVEEAHPLRGALRHAQDAVGDVGLAAAVHLQPARPRSPSPPCPRSCTPSMRAWAGLSMGS